MEERNFKKRDWNDEIVKEHKKKNHEKEGWDLHQSCWANSLFVQIYSMHLKIYVD
jgi:hypothetical protein